MHKLNLYINKLNRLFNKNCRQKQQHRLEIKQVLKKLRAREHYLLNQINTITTTEGQEKTMLLGAQIIHQQRRKGIDRLKSIR
jgi:hypothetical protein